MLAADVQKKRHTEKAGSITEGLMILFSWKPMDYCRYKTETHYQLYTWLQEIDRIILLEVVKD